MLGDADLAIQIAPRTAEVARLAFAARERQCMAVIDRLQAPLTRGGRLLFATRAGAFRIFREPRPAATTGRHVSALRKNPLRLHDLSAASAIAATPADETGLAPSRRRSSTIRAVISTVFRDAEAASRKVKGHCAAKAFAARRARSAAAAYGPAEKALQKRFAKRR